MHPLKRPPSGRKLWLRPLKELSPCTQKCTQVPGTVQYLFIYINIPFVENYKVEIQTWNVFTRPKVLEQDCCSVQNEYISLWNIINSRGWFSIKHNNSLDPGLTIIVHQCHKRWNNHRKYLIAYLKSLPSAHPVSRIWVLFWWLNK